MLKIILCAFNEAQNLSKLLSDLIEQLNFLQREFEIIFCLDCSNDNSFEIINGFKNQAKITILEQENVRGLGLAYKKNFRYVLANSLDQDLIISLDCDNTHNPNQLKEMIEYFEKNSLDLLVASRFFDKSIVSSFPAHRKFISKATSKILQILFSVKNIHQKNVIDYTSGYRIYRLKALRMVYQKYQEKFIEEPEFTYTCEILIKIFNENARIDEYPLNYDYTKKIGKSKLRILKNFKRLVLLILKLKFFSN